MVAIVVVVVLAGGGLTAFLALGTPAPTAAEQAADRLPAPKAIVWTRCSDDSLAKLRARCGSLTVPLDWSKPNGTTIRLAVSRIAHTGSSFQGVVVFNAGGPGVSGLTIDTDEKALPARVRAEYDWVGYRARGVGSSKPALSCDGHYFDGPRSSYAPTAADVSAWTVKAEGYATACAKNGALLAHMSTTDSAKDLDRLRAALGQPQITFYGFSFGTYLGQVYATLFPDRLLRMVLDSTVDPRAVVLPDAFGDGVVAAERAMRKFFAWVATSNSTYGLGATQAAVEQRFAEVETRLATRPVGEVGADEWLDTFLSAGYDESYWPYLTDHFRRRWTSRRATRPIRCPPTGSSVPPARTSTPSSWPSTARRGGSTPAWTRSSPPRRHPPGRRRTSRGRARGPACRATSGPFPRCARRASTASGRRAHS